MADVTGYGAPGTPAIGQGYAFVLPEGKAGEHQMHLAQEHTAQLQARALLQQKRQQELEDQFHKEYLEQKLPEAQGGYLNTVRDNFNKFQKDAVNYKITRGKDPYSDPEFMAAHNDNLTLAANSNQYGKQLAELNAKIDADKANDLNADDKLAIKNAWEQFNKGNTDLFKSPLPQLRGRDYTENDLVAANKPQSFTDKDGYWAVKKPNSTLNRANVYATAFGDPRFTPLLKKSGIIPEFGGIGEVVNNKGRYFPTNDNAVAGLVQGVKNNITDPNVVRGLQAVGLDPNDRLFDEKLAGIIKNQNQAKLDFVTRNGKALDNLISPERERQFTADANSMQHQRLNMEQQRLQMEKAKQAAPDDGRDEFMQKFMSNDQQAYDQLINAVKIGGGKFSPNKNGFTVVIPEKRIENVPILTPGGKPTGRMEMKEVGHDVTYTVDNKGGDAAYETLNRIINHTDLFTKRPLYKKKENEYSGAKPTGANIAKRQADEPDKTYKASNGTSYTHAQLLKAGYTEDMIKKAIELGTIR